MILDPHMILDIYIYIYYICNFMLDDMIVDRYYSAHVCLVFYFLSALESLDIRLCILFVCMFNFKFSARGRSSSWQAEQDSLRTTPRSQTGGFPSPKPPKLHKEPGEPKGFGIFDVMGE